MLASVIPSSFLNFSETMLALFNMSKKFHGRLGAGYMESDKPVVLFDDYKQTYRDFDTVKHAIEARQHEAENIDMWAVFKMIFEFNPATACYDFQG